MSEQLKDLFKLQKVDSGLDELNRKLDNLPVRKELCDAMDRHKQAVEQFNIVNIVNEEFNKKLKKFENELNVLESKIKKEESRLYSGTVVNPKELKGLQDEIASLNRKKDGLETEELEVLEQIDGVKENSNKIEKDKTLLEQKINDLKQTFDEQKNIIGQQVKELKDQRQQLISSIESALIEKYEKTKAEKHGVGVAIIVDRICSGCRIDIPAIEISRINEKGELARCPNCKRLLIPQTVEIEQT